MAAECVFRAYYCPVAAGSVAAPPALHIHVQEKNKWAPVEKKQLFLYIYLLHFLPKPQKRDSLADRLYRVYRC